MPVTHPHPTIEELRRAIETRDSRSLKFDNENPPSNPRTISGEKEIGEFLDDVCSRDMTHKLEMGVNDGRRLAFVEGCKYGDGTRVIASSTAELGDKGIVRQTTVQAWDS
jgi:hypothetical protein